MKKITMWNDDKNEAVVFVEKSQLDIAIKALEDAIHAYEIKCDLEYKLALQTLKKLKRENQ